MKSVLAVSTQITLSGSNYVVFMLMARWLDDSEFVAFSTAVGLNMLASALAEGGLSYVAPKALAGREPAQFAPLAGAFLIISISLYLVIMVGGSLLWNRLADQSLNTTWVLAYALFFAPVLWMPSWITCWFIDRPSFLVVLVTRASIMAAVAWWPNLNTLAVCGLVFGAQVLWLLQHRNRERSIVAFPDRAALREALVSLRAVFLARTMSYSMYAALPLIVGVMRGNAEAAIYVTAERLKALYATLFQPLIQTIYLSQFQSVSDRSRKLAVSIGLHTVNLLVCGLALIAARFGWLDVLGQRFIDIAAFLSVWLAAAASVASACLLMLHIFPAGDYHLFRRAAVLQTLGFLCVSVMLWRWPQQSVVSLLLGGEAVLLVALSAQMLAHRKQIGRP